LRAFGYSKDHRFNTTQVVLALATNSDGLPIGYELFSGKTAEAHTLCKSIESWQYNFNIRSVCFVADRAMMSELNIKLLEEKGYTYVIAAKLRSMPQILQKQILDHKNDLSRKIIFDNETRNKDININKDINQDTTKDVNKNNWVKEFTYKNRRLIVSYQEKRAIKDIKHREQMLAKVKKSLGENGDTKKLISNKAIIKFTTTKGSKTVISYDKIERDKQWDGLHGVITNRTDLDAF